MLYEFYTCYSARRIGFLLEEYHSSTTDESWNPVYYIVNRQRVFHSKYANDILSTFDGTWEGDMSYPKLDINYCPRMTSRTLASSDVADTNMVLGVGSLLVLSIASL